MAFREQKDQSLDAQEKSILSFWKEEDIFGKSIRQHDGNSER
jgi:isoleucyl-tRNA synthetase